MMGNSVDINIKQVMLTVVTLKLGSKKVTSSMLDQIPRLDFCELLVDEDVCFDSSPNIVPVARFSLAALLNSERRVYKAKGFDSDYIRRLIKRFDHNEEAFLFTFEGQLYCDSFSPTTGTKEFGNVLLKLRQKLDECNSRLVSVNRVLDLEVQGFVPQDIVSTCSKRQASLPRGRRTKRELNNSDDWDDVLAFGESDEKVASHELNVIIKTHGSWEQYIQAMKQEVKVELNNKTKLESELDSFNEKVSTQINEILSSPFAILGC